MSNNKRGLGKGLGALFLNTMEDDIEKTDDKNNIKIVKIFEVKPNKNQPRKLFDEKLLSDLAESIKKHGILQPILVRRDKMGEYQIIAGERRWRAAKQAGLKEVPVIVRDLEDLETMEIALIENLQRADLNAIEEALGYKYLIDKYNMSQDDVASKVGKSRPVISNTLRLLKLPDEVIELVRFNKISAGHARALLALNDEETIKNLAKDIVENNLSVRDVEECVKAEKMQTEEQVSNSKNIKSLAKVTKNEEKFYKSLQKSFIDDTKRNLKINYNRVKKSVEIEFYNKEDLEKIIQKLKVEE